MLKKCICTIGICLLLVGTAFAAPFTDHSNATVSDSATGLIWQQTDDDVTRTWQGALDYCNALTLAGQSDWRLPNIKELDSIVDETTLSPAINTVTFPGTNPAEYWSSTTDASSANYACYLHFMNGRVDSNFKTSRYYYARCVR